MALADAVPYAVAHWALDEASGTRYDSVGSNDLTDVNTVGVGTGKFDSAADFEADNSEGLTIADNSDLSMGDEVFSFRAWVQLESTGTDRTILAKGTSSGSGEYYLLYRSSSGRFEFSVYGAIGFLSGATVVANNFGAPSTGVWYLIHAWHDSAGNQIGISVNAGTADTTSHSSGCHDAGGLFSIGAGYEHSPLGQFWDGLIDDVIILKGYILDATERSEDYNSGTGVAFADWAGGGAGTNPKNVFGLALHGPLRRVVF